MDYENACRLFEFDSSEELTEETIRKKYLKLCLKHHPDKNVGNEESVATFQNLQEAYIVLLEEDNLGDLDDDIMDTSGVDLSNIGSMIPKWLQSAIYMIGEMTSGSIPFGSSSSHIPTDASTSKLDSASRLIQENPIFIKIVTKIKERIITWAKSLDRDVLWNVHQTIQRITKSGNGDKFQYIEKILADIIQEKTCKDRHITLEPRLEDLFAHNIIRHIDIDPETNQEQLYVIPSWMEESVFDCPSATEGELVFTCIPKCPIDVHIDKHRNIHVLVSYHVFDLGRRDENDMVDVEICPGYSVSFKIANLYFRKVQTIVFTRRGIPRGNMKDVFDTSNISDVIVHVSLDMSGDKG